MAITSIARYLFFVCFLIFCAEYLCYTRTVNMSVSHAFVNGVEQLKDSVENTARYKIFYTSLIKTKSFDQTRSYFYVYQLF